ncbi:DUF7639 domain-containing protein [Gimesia fumaroli]|uniref:Uncharacterized protein n=1 Tax=Gimesia fumaroli TaxID=2527976 RepID=A0A518IJB9_9PLAN|nr:hypothetical protein [Gimesia fumaroli]QDV53189.1 hypothetical protein Enr17x_52610 [Gimesia fumaroli]
MSETEKSIEAQNHIEIEGNLYRCKIRCVLEFRVGTLDLCFFYLLENGEIYFKQQRLSFSEFSSLFEKGKITASPPEEGVLNIPDLMWAEFSNALFQDHNEDFLLEIQDELSMLQGKPGAVELCKQAFCIYQKEPTPDKKQALRVAYDNVPEHLRCWLGSFDIKDSEIRDALK